MSSARLLLSLAIGITLGGAVPLMAADTPASAKPPVVPLTVAPAPEKPAVPASGRSGSISQTPQQAIRNFEIPAGYRLELVVAEPHIAEPVMAVFDGNGRMYVAEMLTYMQDVDATGEMRPVSRVSRHEDTDGDGVMDKHTVFADHLLLPRILLTLDDRVIIGETNTDDLYCYRDTNGDGVADEKTLWFQGGPRGGNLEHQPNGLLWALDNGLYSTYHSRRLKFTTGKVVKEEIPGNQGQWGLTQDDFGKVWFMHAGLELGPVHYQAHILYGQLNVPGEPTEEFKAVWPSLSSPDVQGGPFQLREDGTLNHFTATCGQDIFRGDRLPADLRGDLLFAEPVGRLIRRAKIEVKDGLTRLTNAYPGSEFIRTKDPLFRPVNMTTAPDGTLYLVDMYRGIIQEGEWTKEGSYLRGQIQKLDLAKEVGRGRIYRLVHDDFKPGPRPRMLDETPAQWVGHLAHPNGWWRDTAQKLLILKGDKSVVPAIRQLVAATTESKVKAQALWTLEGLGELTPDLVLAALRDAKPEIRHTGLRLSEPFLKDTAHADLLSEAGARLQDADPSVVIQAMLSLKHAGVSGAKELAHAATEKSTSAGVYAINEQIWQEETPEDPFLLPLLGPAGLKSYRAGRVFYESLCFACHGKDGLGTPSVPGRTIAPSLRHSPRLLGPADSAITILLQGLDGPLDGTDYGAPMISMATYTDQQLADVLTYVRNSFGNRSPAVQPADIAAARAGLPPRAKLWTPAELSARDPILSVPLRPLANRAEWKFTASHGGATAARAVDGDPLTGFLTNVNPYKGMWFQVELPRRATLRGLTLDSDPKLKSPYHGYPDGYEIRVSDDGVTWSEPVAAGPGEYSTRIHFLKPVATRFVRIIHSEKTGWHAWSITNLELYGTETSE